MSQIMYALRHENKFVMAFGGLLLFQDKNLAVKRAQDYAKANDCSGVEVVRLHFTVHSCDTVVVVKDGE